MRVKDRVAIITGGTGDIGRACVKLFLEEGAKVAVVGRSQQKLDALKEEYKGQSDSLMLIQADVANWQEMQDMAAAVEKQFGKIDILVAAAGIMDHHPIEEMPIESWKKVIDINLTGAFLTCKAVVPYMKKNQYGRIVTISSIAGRTGRPGAVNYSASKAGVVGLTIQMAYDLGVYGITANAVAPGPLLGGMMLQMSEEEKQKRIVNARVPRLGTLEEAAYGILYLASEEAGWTTGEVLDINGGLAF